ncbi:MAG: hypothetical protein JNJ83_04835 [Verrucomicrobiaceae bacterium]|nr:hypothetical protein [Verrucomicrobiaceae bacterium]
MNTTKSILSSALLLLLLVTASAQTVDEALREQEAKYQAIRTRALPTEPASKVCEIIEGSKSPNGLYAFGYKDDETTCLVDLKADKVIAWSAVWHLGPNQSYNNNTHEAAWSKDSTQVVQMQQGNWETQNAEAFRITDGKATWLGDVRKSLIAAAAAKEKENPKFAGVLTVEKPTFGKNGTLTGSGFTQVPRGDEDGTKFTFSGTFKAGSFEVKSLSAK